MVADLVAVTGAPGGLPGTLAEQAYTLPPGLSYAEWEAAGVSLRFMHKNINWWVGDWLVYGEAAYGQEAYQACLDGLAALLGREAESVGQCAWVAARFPPAARQAGLSWSHHRAVLLDNLAPEAGRALLADAAANAWTVAELSAQAAGYAAAIDGAVQPGTNGTADGGAVAEGAPGPWLPTPDDLTEEARAACVQYAARLRVAPDAAGRIWCAALYWAGQQVAFTRWEE